MTGTWHVIAWRRQALAAVSHADQSWIIASIVSRRTGRCSDLVCGLHRINRRARIHRDKPEPLSGFAAGVVFVTTAALSGFVLVDRRAT
jgi:hypothetical protein